MKEFFFHTYVYLLSKARKKGMEFYMKKVKKIFTVRRILVLLFILICAIINYISLRGSFLEYKELGQNYIDIFWKNIQYKYNVMIFNFIFLYIIMYFTGRKIKKDLKVLERISAVLIPVFIAFAISLIWGRGEIKFNYPVDGASKNTTVLIIKSIIYPAMNVFIALPLILGAGKNERPRVCFLSSLFFAVFVCVLSVVVLSLVCGKVNFSGYDIPMLSATEGSALFYFCFFIAGATSFFSAMYALSPFVQKTFYRKDTPIKGIKGYLLSLLFSLSVFGFSLLGLNFIVDYFYPLIGVVGLFIITRCAIKHFTDVRSNKAKKKEHTHR